MLNKKLLCFMLLIAAAFLSFACTGPVENEVLDNGGLDIVCTVFPAYDWVKNITAGCEDVTVTLLIENGADLHSYQPSAADIVRIAESDFLISVGGQSDGWAYDAAVNAGDVRAVSLLDLLGDNAKTEEITEGMEHTHEHEESAEPGEKSGHEDADHVGDEDMDEHVWLSLKNAALFTERLTELLCEVDADQAERFRANAAAYCERLAALDAAYQSAVDDSPQKVFVVADRFPFRYLADDYGLSYYAAFPGCSAESDASFDTVLFLADKLAEYGLSHVAVTESTDGAVARAVCLNTEASDVQTVTLDSMQSLSDKDIAGGASYLAVMEQNLEALKTLLS